MERLEKVPEQNTHGPGGSNGAPADAIGQQQQCRWQPAGHGEGRCEKKGGPGAGEPCPDVGTTFKPLGNKMRDWRE